MKHLMTLIASAALISTATAGGPAGKLFGGFAPNYKFKLTLTENPSASVVSLSGGSGPLSKVPAGFPKFRKGEKVAFKIGSKGQLIVQNFSIPFAKKTSTASENIYTETLDVKRPSISQAALIKKNGKPDFMNLALRKTTGSGLSTKAYQVVYLLD